MIHAECPNCEEQFQLQPSMAGKTTRCPQCKTAFVVPAGNAPKLQTPPQAPPQTPPQGTPQTPPRRTNTEDLYERIETDPVTLPTPEVEAATIPSTLPVAKPLPPAAAPTLPKAPWAATPLAKAPSVMLWDENLAPPEPNKKPATSSSSSRSQVQAPEPGIAEESILEEVVDPLVLERRLRRRRQIRGQWIALALLGATLFTGLISAFGYWRYTVLAEQRLYEEAQFEYEEGNLSLAREKYEQLLEQYPESSQRGEYQFFADLTTATLKIRAASTTDDPLPAHDAFLKFTTTYADNPWAAPETGYGVAVVQMGKQLADALAEYGTKRLAEFQADRTKLALLATVESTARTGEELIPVVEKFLARTDSPLDRQRERFAELQAARIREQKRLEILNPYRDLAVEPTALRIETFEQVLKEHQLATDAEALGWLAEAERRLRELPGYLIKQQPAKTPEPETNPPLLFTAPLGTRPTATGGPVPPSDAVPIFSIARGVLYALDPATGELRWGQRLASPTADLRKVDLPLVVPMGDDDWAFVAGEIGGIPSITARRARTGEAIWHQALEAPLAARPLIVGSRLYTPLANEAGTVVEFDANSGLRLGEFILRQPIGAGLTAMPTDKPGGYVLFVPADAKRIYLYELGREDANGDRLPPQRIRVLITDHPRGSLRGETRILGPADESGPRYLVLTQTDGPTKMKLRSFPLAPIQQLLREGQTGPIESRERAAEVALSGWSWFPAVTDGEKFLLTTDAGALFAFGIQQAGNLDAPLFPIAAPEAPPQQDQVSRSLVVSAEEDAFWLVVGGQLLRYRLAVSAQTGLRLIVDGAGRAVGEPIVRGQVRREFDRGYITTREVNGSVQAVCFHLNTGQILWTQRLGIVPAGPAIALGNGQAVVVDQSGVAFRVSPSEQPHVERLTTPSNGGKATIAHSPDGQTIWIAQSETDSTGQKLRLRLIRQGQPVSEVVVPLPDEFAGEAVVLGEDFLIPLKNGYVYRYRAGASRLEAGPLWRSDGSTDELRCQLSSVDRQEFLVSDGRRKFWHWRWAEQPEKLVGPWELANPLAVPPLLIRDESGSQIVAIDELGILSVFASERVADPIRRKRPSPGGIPTGRPTRRLLLLDDFWIVYTIADRHLVAVPRDPKIAELVFEHVVPLGTPNLLEFQNYVLSDTAGALRRLHLTEQKLHPWQAPPPGTPPLLSGAVPLTPRVALAIGFDGCGCLIPIPEVQ